MRIFKFFESFFRKRQFKKVVIIENDALAKPISNTIIIVKKNNLYTWVKFYCPCGCERIITLSLSANIKPFWSIKVNNDKVTISPSVHSTGFPCKSHFFIRDNKIDWV